MVISFCTLGEEPLIRDNTWESISHQAVPMEGKTATKVPPLCLGMVLGMVGLANPKARATDAVVGWQRLVRRLF